MNHSVGDSPWLQLKAASVFSRLIVGIEQYSSPELIRDVLKASGAEFLIVTASLGAHARGVPIAEVLDSSSGSPFILLTTTSLAQSPREAITIAGRLRDSLGISVVKLDIRPDKGLSLPDNSATIRAAAALIADGFEVLPMIVPDPLAALELQKLGCSAIRLMAGPLRGRRGITNLELMLRAREAVSLPCIAEGGIAGPADAARLIESGFDAVLVNTAIAASADPPLMAAAMRLAVEAGRYGYRATNVPLPAGVGRG